MDALWDMFPWIAAMLVLIGCSAFFSASEAALFSLRGADRRKMALGTKTQRLAEKLLHQPERLLSAVLFWNLAVNICYFAIAAMVEARWSGDRTTAICFGIGSLLTLIFFSEMVPKSLAVIQAPLLSAIVSVPLALATRLLDPIMPVLQTVMLLSRRLLWPGLKPQPYLNVRDLERAIEISTSSEELVDREQAILRNIVQLSELQVQEWMRPRKQFRSFTPPVMITDLEGELTLSRYLLVTETNSDEIESAVYLPDLFDLRTDHLEVHATPVIYVPWCATVADAFEQLKRESAEVAAVVNEWGETIGIVTLQDIFDAMFTESPERHERLLLRNPIAQIASDVWHVAGMTNLRRLARHFALELPPSRNVTIAGVVQEELEGHAEVGDTCQWGPFQIRVVSIDSDHEPRLELKLIPSVEEESL